MDFEVTNVIDSPVNRRRICIEKQVPGFPHFTIPTIDQTYEGFDAKGFRHTRDHAFTALSEYFEQVKQHRRFIQNDTFIADTLEIMMPRDVERDLNYRQHINVTVVQMHAKTDPTSITENAREDDEDCLKYVQDLYTKNYLSTSLPSYQAMEMMVLRSASFLKIKKPKFKVVANPYGLVINFRSLPANGEQMFTYALGIKHKRFARR
mgnify:CR=1 FL=1